MQKVSIHVDKNTGFWKSFQLSDLPVSLTEYVPFSPFEEELTIAKLSLEEYLLSDVQALILDKAEYAQNEYLISALITSQSTNQHRIRIKHRSILQKQQVIGRMYTVCSHFHNGWS